MKILLIIALGSLGIFAQKGKMPQKLTSETWNLIEIDKKFVSNSKAFLKFNAVGNQFTGDGGCNQIYGKFKLKGSSLKLREIGLTKMFCAEDNLMKVESDFVNALRKVTRYALTENELTLYAGRQAVLKFSNKPNVTDENPQLSGKKWILTKIGYGAADKTEEPAFITFSKEKGTVSGYTSCNTFGGKYLIRKEKLMFSEIISTKRACLQGNTMRVEKAFLDGLGKTEWFSIGNGSLILSLGRYNLLTFVEQK